MPSSEQSNTQQDTSHHGDAVADMQERLVQFGRLLGQIRDGLPEQRAEALSRIEQGIAGLSERIAALGLDGQRQARVDTVSTPAVPPDAEEPWDPQSAEDLMRAYERAEAEFSRSGQPARVPAARERPREAQAAGLQPMPSYDRAWLETRLADISALLQRSLADIDPTASLAALDRRLDLFERRLDGALSDMARGTDHAGLKLIDAHVMELAEHFETMREQLTRLDTIDGQLRELTRALEGAQQRPGADAATLSEDAIVTLIDTAAERAASRLAASMPADAGGQGRIEALEQMLQDYVAERRRSEETSAGILRTIEDALVRIIDRVEAMDAARLAPEAPAHRDVPDRDGMEIDNDQLAEVYAAGARVLGQQVSEPSLHAADYVTAGPREQGGTRAQTGSPGSPDEPGPQEEQTHQELRASAIRAKLKAQATPQEPAAEGAGLDEAKARMLGQGRARTWTSARSGSHRFSLLLGVAIALLFGAGFMTVDTFLAAAPPAGVLQKATATQADSVQADSLTPSAPREGSLDAQPAAEPGKADLAPRSEEPNVEPAPIPQPALRRPAPEAVTDDQTRSQPAPTRRLDRLQTGSALASPATPVMLTPSDRLAPTAPDASQAGDEGSGATGAATELHPAVRAAKLRQAAADGDALAQFEIATRFAEGKGVTQDHKRAFALYERAATRGLPAAQFRLAAYFERGIGVEADRQRAKVWYRRAADQGHVRAMHNLGVLSVGGREDQVDYAAAAGWFRQAAERGLADSQFNLAVLHENGRGVPKDLQEAYMWFALAARSGDPESARRLEQIKARMEPGEIGAAEQKLAAWQPTPAEAVTGSIGTPVRR
jgi:localization factor PodJL